MREVIISIDKANKVGICIMLVSAVAYALPYFLIWPEQLTWNTFEPESMLRLFLYYVIFLAGIPVHELIHGITFACFAKKGFKAVSYGVIWSKLTPYAHCDEPLAVRQYVAALLMPFLLLGIAPAIAALIIGHFATLVFAIIFTASAAGDLWIAWLIMKEKKNATILDHPSEPGYYVMNE